MKSLLFFSLACRFHGFSTNFQLGRVGFTGHDLQSAPCGIDSEADWRARQLRLLLGEQPLKRRENTALAVSPPDGVSGTFIGRANVHYSAGDTWNVHTTFTGGTGFTVSGFTADFVADAGTANFYVSVSVSTGATQAFATIGGVWFSGSDANGKMTIRAPGTAKNLIAFVTANTDTAAATFRSRKNSTNGAMAVSVPATTTGLFEDMTNSDALASGDLFGLWGVSRWSSQLE